MVLVPVTFVGIVNMTGLVAVVLVSVSFVDVVVVQLGLMLVGVAFVDVVVGLVAVVLVGVAFVNFVRLHPVPP